MTGDDDVVMVDRKGKGKAIQGETEADNLPWVEKYRPADLNDLISHKDILSTITRFIEQGKLPHMLFYGPPGTGKTSTILAVAKRIYGPSYKSMILELNASDDRGIDVVREKIKTFASTSQLFSSGFKLIVLDEADAMTQIAQNALRRVIEQYTKNVRFCIICNYVGKIIPAVQSRCTRFRFSPLERDQIETRLDYIIASEGVTIDSQGKEALLTLSRGDMRKTLNILQSCYSAFDKITENHVYECTGSPLPSDVSDVLNWLLTFDFTTACSNIKALQTEKGLALTDLLSELNVLVASLDMPAPAKITILDKMAEIEHTLSRGAFDKIQLGAVVGTFKLAIELAGKLSQ